MIYTCHRASCISCCASCDSMPAPERDIHSPTVVKIQGYVVRNQL